MNLDEIICVWCLRVERIIKEPVIWCIVDIIDNYIGWRWSFFYWVGVIVKVINGEEIFLIVWYCVLKKFLNIWIGFKGIHILFLSIGMCSDTIWRHVWALLILLMRIKVVNRVYDKWIGCLCDLETCCKLFIWSWDAL